MQGLWARGGCAAECLSPRAPVGCACSASRATRQAERSRTRARSSAGSSSSAMTWSATRSSVPTRTPTGRPKAGLLASALLSAPPSVPMRASEGLESGLLHRHPAPRFKAHGATAHNAAELSQIRRECLLEQPGRSSHLSVPALRRGSRRLSPVHHRRRGGAGRGAARDAADKPRDGAATWPRPDEKLRAWVVERGREDRSRAVCPE